MYGSLSEILPEEKEEEEKGEEEEEEEELKEEKGDSHWVPQRTAKCLR